MPPGAESVTIEDQLKGQGMQEGIFYLHFHPRWLDEVRLEGDSIHVGDLKIEFESPQEIRKEVYDCPDGYNRYEKAPKVAVTFVDRLVTRIYNQR